MKKLSVELQNCYGIKYLKKEFDLSQSSTDIYNFIRAQSSPYPGAFIKTIDGKKLVSEKARLK